MKGMKLLRTALIIVLAASSTACFDMFKDLFNGSPDEPDRIGRYGALLSRHVERAGDCASARRAARACSGKSRRRSGSQASGDFSATCADGVTLAGTVTASHGDTTIPWASTGTATKGSATCPFNMTGTGTFQGTSNIVVSYAGTSCNGPFSGSETIKR